MIVAKVYATALGSVLAASSDKEKRDDATIAAWLLLLAYDLKGKYTSAHKALLKELFAASDKSKDLAREIKLAMAGKINDNFDFDFSKLGVEHQKVAKQIAKTYSKKDPSYNVVARRVSLFTQDPLITGFFPVAAVKPSGRLTKDDKRKADLQYVRDYTVNAVRQGKKLPEILAHLDQATATKEFTAIGKGISGGDAALLAQYTVTEQGALLFNAEPMVSRAMSPISLWVLRRAKISFPQRSRGEDSYVFAYLPDKGTSPQKAYKLGSVQKANNKKWGAVSELTEKIPVVKAKWEQELKQGNALAALLAFCYLTSARIGTVGNTAVGASILKVKHVSIKANTVIVKYVGKSSTPQMHKFVKNPETKLLFDYLVKATKGKPADWLFPNKDGDSYSNAEVNSWLKSHTSGAVTVHKFRHVRGTEIAIAVLKTLKVPEGINAAQASKLFKTAMEKVGEALGHYNTRGDETKISAMTSIKNYIDPSIGLEWFKNLGLEPPVTLFPKVKQ